jgi:hypothetical protein
MQHNHRKKHSKDAIGECEAQEGEQQCGLAAARGYTGLMALKKKKKLIAFTP